MTPIESEEVNKKLQELLDRGLIREISSPCTVPTILTPKKNGEWWMCTYSRDINKTPLSTSFIY